MTRKPNSGLPFVCFVSFVVGIRAWDSARLFDEKILQRVALGTGGSRMVLWWDPKRATIELHG